MSHTSLEYDGEGAEVAEVSHTSSESVFIIHHST